MESKISKICYKLGEEKRGDIFGFERCQFIYTFDKDGITNFEKTFSDQIALRIMEDKGIGYATISGDADIESLIQNAFLSMRYNDKRIDLGKYHLPKKIKKIQIYDSNIEYLGYSDIENWRNKLQSTIGINTKFNCFIQCTADTINYCRLGEYVNKRINSYKKTTIKILFKVYSLDGELLLYYRKSKCCLFDFIKDIIFKFQDHTNLMKKVRIYSGYYNAVFSPLGVYCILKNFLGMEWNGKLSQGNIEEAIFDKNIIIKDSGCIDWQIGSQPFDDEGTTSQEIVLIQNGKFKNYYTDIVSAERRHTVSSGNAKRGWCVPPTPIMNNIIISGMKEIPKIKQKLNYGILVDYVEELGISDNINGIFCGKIEKGFVIQNGKIINRLEPCIIKVNLKKALKDVIIGNDREWIAGDFCTPEIILKKIKITEK